VIIDFRFTPPTPEGLPRYTAPPKHLRGYAEAFGKRVYGGENPDVRLMSVDELLNYLDRAGVDKALLKSSDNETTQGKKYPMERLAEYISGHEERLIGVAGVDPHKGMHAVRELEWSIKDLGFKAVNLGPYELKLSANDKKYYPLYAKCVELDVPVLLHTSINFSNELLMDFGNPMYVDEVAVDFPELKIVCVHGGWPWITQMVAVAWRHRNVYIEISGIRPRYIAMPGTGYEPLLVYGNSILQNQIVWGSNWPQVTPEEGIEGVKSFPLKDEVKKKGLGENAARLLGLGVRG
jgi:predicted TIM-barrel fold metal-dependent hydrolase